jgi:hypothetical protein
MLGHGISYRRNVDDFSDVDRGNLHYLEDAKLQGGVASQPGCVFLDHCKLGMDDRRVLL